VFGVK